MFEHQNFKVHPYDNIPLNEDCIMMDEKYLKEYEEMMINLFNGSDYENIGYVCYTSVRKVNKDSIVLSWYPDVFTRFHEVSINLPKNELIVCVECWQWSQKPHIFVKSKWYEDLHLKTYSIFSLIDAIGVKEALQNGKLTRDKLISLRTEIDNLAKENKDISFISFADNLLLKSNWTVGHHKSDINYNYVPERFIILVKKLQDIYKRILGLNIYAVLTQGSNLYYNDPDLHISESRNHICLNSLGLPFADLMSIDAAVKSALKSNIHPPSEIYMEEKYFHSLNINRKLRDTVMQNKNSYHNKMTNLPSYYYYYECDSILNNIDHKD